MSVLLFDLSDVVVRGLKGTEHALSDDLQLPPNIIHRQFHEPELRELFLGQIEEEQYLRALLERHRWNITLEHLQQRIRNNMVELDGMFALLEELQQRGHTMALLSNHTDAWVRHMESRYPQIEHYFPTRLYSHTIHLAKPDPLAFRLAAETLKTRPQEILFIDDHHPNLIGAASTGMQTLQFHTPHQLRNALVMMGHLAVDSIHSPAKQ